MEKKKNYLTLTVIRELWKGMKQKLEVPHGKEQISSLSGRIWAYQFEPIFATELKWRVNLFPVLI